MADVLVCDSRSDKVRVAPVVAAIEAKDHARADPDRDLPHDPRFKAMVAAAETRLAAPNDGCAAPGA